MQKVLFARIGHMLAYEGPQPGDEKPKGGGGYNKTKVGHEAFNFKQISGRHFGYFQPTVKSNGKPSTINLERIDPTADGNVLQDVTVIFFATHPRRRTAEIVGWYSHATIYREYQQPSPKVSAKRNGFSYNVECTEGDAVLLPDGSRPILYEAPHGHTSKKGMPGRANAFYLYEANGQPRNLRSPELSWARRAVAYIARRQGPPAAPVVRTTEHKKRSSRRKGGQGWMADASVRRAVEDHAMEVSKQHYEKLGYKVEDTHLTESYDLLCRRGRVECRIEVKGTTGAGTSVQLTKNEVASAKLHPTELFILHSVKIKVGTAPVPSGGTRLVLKNWVPEEGLLKPLTFQYNVPDRR